FVKPIGAAVVFEHHVVGEIVDDARRSVALCLDFDDCQSGRPSNFVKKVASCRKGRLWQYWKKLARCICWRRCAAKLVAVDDLARRAASVRPIDSELSRLARTKAFDMMRYRCRIFWIAAAPFLRIDSPERRLSAREPGFFHLAGMAHEAARKQFGIVFTESLRQGVDQSRLADIGVDHRKVAVDLHSRRCERAAIP